MSDLVSSFVQAAHYTPATGRPVDLIVIHDMEAPEAHDTAENVAKWFAGPSAPQASAHYCIDDNSIVQCVKDNDVAWHAPGANHNGLGFEHAGYAAQNLADWSDPYSKRMLVLSARLAAEKCKQYRIPAVYLRAADLVAGRRGITTHFQVTLAFSHGVGHTDPGPAFPIDTYVAAVALGAKAADTKSDPVPVPVQTPPPTLARGASGWQVKRAQKLLGVTPDGMFGPGTEKAVVAFQRAHHLQPDGVLGALTWGELLHANFGVAGSQWRS